MSSIRRTIQVLDLLARKGALGVRAVAQQLALPVGSVHRLLLDLADENVVERNAEGAWQLTYRLFEITDLQLEGVRFPRLARPYCESIAQETGETVNVNVLTGDGCVCIDKVRGNEGMQLDWRIGSRGPLHCGGTAKAMLAFLSESDQARIASAPMEQYTPNTITDPAELRAELARIRKRGYAIDNQEVVMGVFCVGGADRRSRRPAGWGDQHFGTVEEGAGAGRAADGGAAPRGLQRGQQAARLCRYMAATAIRAGGAGERPRGRTRGTGGGDAFRLGDEAEARPGGRVQAQA